MTLHRLARAFAIAFLAAPSAFAADIVLTPPVGGGVAVTNAAGTTNQLRVADDGTTLAGNLILGSSTPTTGNVMKGASRFIHNFGSFNTFIGMGAGNFTLTGDGNTASGALALQFLSTGFDNTASGAGALHFNTLGSQNTATGAGALSANTSGNDNTAGGREALSTNQTGNRNTAVGVNALSANKTDDNTAVGSEALKNNAFGTKNTASGGFALRANTSGSNNTANGWNALGSNTTGIFNSAMGESALFNNTAGSFNTASGTSALTANSTGTNNTASGGGALLLNTTGNYNSAVGSAALSANKTGENNTAIGKGALYIMGRIDTAGAFITGASYTIQSTGNTDFTLIGAASNLPGTIFIASGPGVGTGTAASNANENIALGANAGSNLTTGSLNIAIGHGGFAGESSTIRIGQAQTRTFIAGISGNPSGVGLGVLVDATGQLGTVVSSRRFKDDVVDMDAASSGLMGLRPVTFHYRSDQDPAGRTLQYGLVAEEVAKVYPGLVARSADGQFEGVRYHFLPTMLLNEVQKQQRTITEQAARLVALEGELAAIKHAIGLR